VGDDILDGPLTLYTWLRHLRLAHLRQQRFPTRTFGPNSAEQFDFVHLIVPVVFSSSVNFGDFIHLIVQQVRIEAD